MRIFKTIAISAVVGVLVILGLVFLFPKKSSPAMTPEAMKVDSGVVACQQIAENSGKAKSQSGNAMTQEQRIARRTPFENSNDPELFAAGTNFVDAVWEAQQALNNDDVDLASSFGIITKLEVRYGVLQLACKKHGVELPPFKS